MSDTFKIAKFTRAKLSLGEAITSNVIHNCVGGAFQDAEATLAVLDAPRHGCGPLGRFVGSLRGDWRLHCRNHKKAFALLLQPERITQWNTRGRNMLPWLLGDLVNDLRTGKAKRWFRKDGSPSANCPKRARVAMRILHRYAGVWAVVQQDPKVAGELRAASDAMLEQVFENENTHPALAYLMFAWLPCQIHYGMSPAQLMRQARDDRQLEALEDLLRIDKQAWNDKRLRRRIDAELMGANRSRARRIRRALEGAPKPINRYTLKVRIAALFRRFVPGSRLMNTESIRRIADCVAHAESGGRIRRDLSLGSGGEGFTRGVHRSAVLYRAVASRGRTRFAS